MKLTYFESGDNSVGIGDIIEDITFGKFLSDGLKDLSVENRQQFKKEFADLIGNWLSEPNAKRYITFDDECFECYTKLINDKCKNKYCLAYYKREGVKK